MKKISWKTFILALSVLALAMPLTTQASGTGDDPDEGRTECPEEFECIETRDDGGGDGDTSISAGPGFWDIATIATGCPDGMICAEWISATGRDNYMDGDVCCIFFSAMQDQDYDDDYADCQVLVSKRSPRDDETSGGDSNDPGDYNGQGGNGAAI